LQGAWAGDPLIVECAHLIATQAALLGKSIHKVAPAGSLVESLGINVAQSSPESRVADPQAHHMKDEHGLAVADGLAGRVVAASEGRQGKVLRACGEKRVLFERAQAIVPGLLEGMLLLGKVIGHVSGQPLAPIAPVSVHQHAVAPPAVGHLVSETGIGNEGQSQHAAAQQRK
jgi:hypothetical protein